MKSYEFMHVDAFTTRALGGNPCAVVFDAHELDDATMLALAREMNLSETAFVIPSDVADFGARYFTPDAEIPMAGHPTIATVHSLVESGRLNLSGDVTPISLELRVGPISIDIHAGEPMRIVMSQKAPEFLRTYDPAIALPAFGLAADDVLPGVPIQTVSTGTPQLMAPLRGLDALKPALVHVKSYLELKDAGDFFGAHLFCLEGATKAGDTFARHFVPPGIPEDPFTGSATGGMAAYLWRYDLLSKPNFVAEQGHWMNRPGEASVEVIGPRENIETVKVGGSAVTVVRGELVL